MTWTAPQVHRIEPSPVGDERATLTGYLDYQRQTLLWKCSGLSGEQLTLRPVPPSTLSLLGLVRHMSDVERSWFRIRMSAEDVALRYWTNESPDADFDDGRAGGAQRDYESLVEEMAVCRDRVASRELGDTFVHPRTAETLSVRWLLAHLIEEYARHNGHADLLRQAIDGAVGE